jgi:hypothetical protein
MSGGKTQKTHNEDLVAVHRASAWAVPVLACLAKEAFREESGRTGCIRMFEERNRLNWAST